MDTEARQCSNPAHWDEPHPCPLCADEARWAEEIARLRTLGYPVFAAALVAELKEECERQYARAEKAEAQVRIQEEEIARLRELLKVGYGLHMKSPVPSGYRPSPEEVEWEQAALQILAITPASQPEEPRGR